MKSIFASKTFWGAISGLIVSLLSISGVEIASNEVQTVVEAAGAIVSTILVVWCRYTASKRVTLGKTDTAGTIGLVLLMCLLSPGCQHHWPKDSYIQGGSSTINTPWGSSIQKIQVLATGKAAEAISRNPPPPATVENVPPTTSSKPAVPPPLNDTP